MLGTLLIGLSTNSCKNKSTAENTVYKNDTVEERIADCYEGVGISTMKEFDIIGNDSVFHIVEHFPSFPGGNEALLEFLKNNYHIPETNKEGRMFIRFIVRATGKIDDIVILRSLSAEHDKEAIRLIESMPLWIPGKQNGKEVDAYFILPIRVNP